MPEKTFASGDVVFSTGGVDDTPDNHIKTGEFPAGCEIIPNPHNQILGFQI